MTETQERFLRAVAERLPLDRVAELHLFPSIRQGGVETGVAVVAVEAPAADAGAPPRLHDAADAVIRPHPSSAPGTEAPPPRHTIFSARYRLTLKGPDCGRWEADVVAEADAPLATADAVVRGVRKRTGEAADAERVSPETLRQLAAQPA